MHCSFYQVNVEKKDWGLLLSPIGGVVHLHNKNNIESASGPQLI